MFERPKTVLALDRAAIETSRFQIFTAEKIQVEVLWVVTPCRVHPEDGGCNATRCHNPKVLDLNLPSM
jgi:hypothetical protein